MPLVIHPMRVCIGGTFDRLHRGHMALIDRAFEIAGKKGRVFIGVVKQGKRGALSFKERKEELVDYLKRRGFLERAEILPIFDRYGVSIDGDFDAIVVSNETLPTAEEINERRKEKGKKSLNIVCIPFILADNGKPISSSRIRRGEIDREGRLKKVK
jgi:pantetheine-phosphate adenylyltransferase